MVFSFNFFRFFYSLNHIFPSIFNWPFFYYRRNYKADRPTGLKLIDFLPVSFCIQFFSNFISNAIILFPVQRTGNLKWNQDTQKHIEHHSEALTLTGMLEPHCVWKPTKFHCMKRLKGFYSFIKRFVRAFSSHSARRLLLVIEVFIVTFVACVIR